MSEIDWTKITYTEHDIKELENNPAWKVISDEVARQLQGWIGDNTQKGLLEEIQKHEDYLKAIGTIEAIRGFSMLLEGLKNNLSLKELENE